MDFFKGSQQASFFCCVLFCAAGFSLEKSFSSRCGKEEMIIEVNVAFVTKPWHDLQLHRIKIKKGYIRCKEK